MKNKSKVLAVILGVLGLLCIALFFVFNILNKPIYVINFDTDGGSIIASVEVEENDKLERPTDPKKEGYEFLNWNYNNNVYDFNLKVTSNMTLVAKWKEIIVEPEKYNVTFKLGDKEESLNVSDFKDIDLDKLGFEEKSGHIIKWYLSGEEYDEDKKLTSDITLEGKYVKVNTFTIKFNSNGGTSVKNQTVKTDEKVIEPKNVTKDGYVLDGWYLNSEKYNFNTKVNKSFTLTAKWSEDPSIKRYTVSFDSDGGTNIENQRIKENDTITRPKDPTKNKFIFEYWLYNDKKFDFKTKVTSDMELKAKWREPAKYKVTFNSDGSVYKTYEVLEGEIVNEPAKPSKDGNEFIEWQLDGKKYDFKNKITKNITLNALFKVKDETCTVTFDTNGGGSVASQSVKCGNKLTKLPSISRVGFALKGWKIDDDEFDINTTLITKNVTLIAIWEEKNCLVTFDTKGGSQVASQTIKCGAKITQIPTTTRNDYVFDSWQLDNTNYNFDSVVNTDITLVAKWNDIYTVTFDTDGGSSIQSQKVEKGKTVKEPTSPTKENSVFDGWKLGEDTYDFSTPVTSNITLVARWKNSEDDK